MSLDATRTGVFIFLLIYLGSLFFIIGGIYSSFDTQLYYNYTNSESTGDIDFLGMHVGIQHTFFGSVITGIADLPAWFNWLFIVMPSALLFIFGILMFIPTMPSG